MSWCWGKLFFCFFLGFSFFLSFRDSSLGGCKWRLRHVRHDLRVEEWKVMRRKKETLNKAYVKWKLQTLKKLNKKLKINVSKSFGKLKKLQNWKLKQRILQKAFNLKQFLKSSKSFKKLIKLWIARSLVKAWNKKLQKFLKLSIRFHWFSFSLNFSLIMWHNSHSTSFLKTYLEHILWTHFPFSVKYVNSV